jgi:phage shock protein C
MPAKRIYRNQREKVLGGVAAGIADYFDVDVAWVRLAFVLSVFVHGIGLLAYIVAWIVFPRDERTGAQIEQVGKHATASLDAGVQKARRGLSSGSRNAVGVLLILLGALFFLDQNFYWFRFDSFWPLLLVGLGLYMIVRATQPDEDALPASAAASVAGDAGASANAAGSAEDVDHA